MPSNQTIYMQRTSSPPSHPASADSTQTDPHQKVDTARDDQISDFVQEQHKSKPIEKLM